jgi:hypothetical protein
VKAWISRAVRQTWRFNKMITLLIYWLFAEEENETAAYDNESEGL